MTKPTGNPRGRPKGSKDVAPVIRLAVKEFVRWWTRGQRWQKIFNALPEKDQAAMGIKLMELGIAADPKPQDSRAGVSVVFQLNGVRGDGPTTLRSRGVVLDAGDAVDITPPALPVGEAPIVPRPEVSTVDPRLYVPAARVGGIEPEPAALTPEQEERRKTALELADTIERELNKPSEPEWQRSWNTPHGRF